MKSLRWIGICTLTLCLALPAAASERISRKLQEEFARLHLLVRNAKPEFVVGGLLNGKRFGDHELLWKLGEEKNDGDVIRIFRSKGGSDSFDVSFHRATHIVPGRTVIRRFVGPGISGWRNDTIDAHSGEYLGSQGARRPRLEARDAEILKQWDIGLFD